MSAGVMQAGREMDAAVAELVMGWTRHRNERHVSRDDTGNLNVDWCFDWVPARFNGDRLYNRPLPQYSTDVASAIDALEVGSAGLGWELERDAGGVYLCVIGYGNYGSADTAPLAICRALLALAGARP